MKLNFRSKIGVALGVALLAICAFAFAAPIKTSKAIYWYFTGAGSGLTLRHHQTTANTKILDAVNNAGTSVASIDIEGDIEGRLVGSTDALQTLAGSGALALTDGKSTFPVISSSGAVTGCTIPNGTTNGQRIQIVGTDDTKTVAFAVNGATNIAAANGQTSRVLGNYDTIVLTWYNAKWVESYFGNNL